MVMYSKHLTIWDLLDMPEIFVSRGNRRSNTSKTVNDDAYIAVIAKRKAGSLDMSRSRMF